MNEPQRTQRTQRAQRQNADHLAFTVRLDPMTYVEHGRSADLALE